MWTVSVAISKYKWASEGKSVFFLQGFLIKSLRVYTHDATIPITQSVLSFSQWLNKDNPHQSLLILSDSSIPAEFGDLSTKTQDVQGSALSSGNPTLWTITGWRLNDSDCRKRLVCDNYSKTEICPLQHFLLYVSFSFFFSVFPFLSYFVTGRHSNPTPACSHTLYCNWLNCFDKCREVKTHLQCRAGLLSGCISPHHTHTHPCTHWYKKQPGIQTQSSVRRKRREKEQQKKSKQTENCKLNVTAVESLTGSERLANWRCRTASVAAMMGLNWRARPVYLKTWCWVATSAGSSRRSGPGKGPPFWHVGADWRKTECLCVVTVCYEIRDWSKVEKPLC